MAVAVTEKTNATTMPQQGDVREEGSSDDQQHQRPREPEAQGPKVKPEEAQEQRLSQTVSPEPRANYLRSDTAALSRLGPGSLVSSPLAAIEAGQAGDKRLVFIPDTSGHRHTLTHSITDTEGGRERKREWRREEEKEKEKEKEKEGNEQGTGEREK
ncbi:hypothetical protein EYF80_012075 [Liparis tanakae]|uniref:Uncharacterized protein n=1 Tax=Liparis tanakae TaxID=230148 RepID=A0A4Z2IJ05_9TELE|nr:hypothetical protein EYF80_012075 [Liparis tanakae]